jgi:ATP-dependent helicase/nuclease subunit B
LYHAAEISQDSLHLQHWTSVAVILQNGRPRSRRTIEERLSGPVFDDLVVIVPTRRRIRHLVREVMLMTGKPVTPAFPFFTFETFGRSLYSSTDAPRRVIAGPVQTLLFQAAVEERQEGLSYFTLRGDSERMFPGTFEKIIEVILHLKETGVLPEILREEAVSAPLDEQHKLNDVAAIYDSYEKGLRNFQATDVAGVFNHFFRECSPVVFQRVFRSVHPQVELISLAGFDEFTPPELGLIQKLTEVPGLAVTVLFDYEIGNPGLFGHLEANYRRFRELGFDPVREEAPRSQSLFPVNTMTRSALSRASADMLARNLFRAEGASATTDLSRSVTLVAALSRRHEVELICRLVRHLKRQDPGLDLGTVCVAVRQPQLYTDLFREECERFGIPANITDRFHLSRSPLVTSLLALLRVPVSGYRRDDVLRIARSPYCSFSPGIVGLDAGNLARVSAQLRITAGKSSWGGKIDRRREIEAEALRDATDPREQQRLRKKVMDLDRAARDIAALGAALGDLATLCTPRMFHRRFLALLSRLEVTRNLVSAPFVHGGDHVERDARAYARFLEAVGEAVRLAEFEHGRETEHPLAYYSERLSTAVLRERYNVREQFGRGILVTSIDETRGLAMKIMIVAGLVDGEFPLLYQPEVFLSAERRKERERRSGWQNRYLFYQAVTNWTDHLYLTYPLREGDIDLVRSSFIDALRAVAATEEWVRPEDLPFGQTLATVDEVLRWAADNPEGTLPAEVLSSGGFAARQNSVMRATDVERSRLTGQALREYEGMVLSGLTDDSRMALARVRDRVLSVSQIETYRKCPFKFFAQRLLLLNATGELEESLTPLEKGAVLHDALFEFFSHRRNAGLPRLKGCSDEEFAVAVRDLAAIVEGRLGQLDVPDAFWDLERELMLGRPGSGGGLIREFLESERNRDVQSVPEFFEVAFGDVGGPKASCDHLLSTRDPVKLGDVRIRGKIDRIEIGEGFFTVVDYKTGWSIPRIEEIREGVSLQLPVYLRVAETLLAAANSKDLVPAAGLYYRLRTPIRAVPGLASSRFNRIAFTAGATSKQVVRTDEDLRELVDVAVNVIGETARDITEGKFPLTAVENVEKYCSACDFRTMCRIQIARHVQPKASEES